MDINVSYKFFNGTKQVAIAIDSTVDIDWDLLTNILGRFIDDERKKYAKTADALDNVSEITAIDQAYDRRGSADDIQPDDDTPPAA